MSNFYESGWRSNKQSGEIGWTNDFNDSSFQQVRAKRGSSAGIDEQFSGLGNTDSDVDDHGAGWKSLKDAEGMTIENTRGLMKQWQDAGYDVRVQDLSGAEGTSQGNIAVRKGKPEAAPVQAIEKEPIKDSAHLAEAKDRVNEWEKKSWSGDRAQETFSPANEQAMNFDATNTPNRKSYDVRNEYTGPNTPDSNAVLNAYKKDFADNFSPNGSSLSNAFSQTALNQQGGDVPEKPSQAQSQSEDDFLKKARGQNLLNA